MIFHWQPAASPSFPSQQPHMNPYSGALWSSPPSLAFNYSVKKKKSQMRPLLWSYKGLRRKRPSVPTSRSKERCCYCCCCCCCRRRRCRRRRRRRRRRHRRHCRSPSEGSHRDLLLPLQITLSWHRHLSSFLLTRDWLATLLLS
ncbi:uncharacterized protein LOC127543907 isoform X2 [Antechinus flavipes]|uniref:uncharacterized protein LOC127543907 isoform X2 n=1 Tax=Antechinus flavipes TaxID=38775 RepID=UPI0022356D8F|nr:uncharacterized protein LOC127543907 isoform X2 [Antechinus flavipes]